MTNHNTRMPTFKSFHESECNVDANELKPGDAVENINPECDHYMSKGVVIDIIKVPQDTERTAGNIIKYRVTNDSDSMDKSSLNGVFHPEDELEKTEIQLKKLNESNVLLERSFDRDCGDICKRFVRFCKSHLELPEPVKIRFLKEKQDEITTACYSPADKQISVLVKDRGLIDVLRSIAHEMVHQKQHAAGELNETSGQTGSDHENQANAQAGVIMRLFQDQHKDEIY